MATYYVNSDLGKERVGSISKVGDRVQMSDGTWIKKTESGYSATKNGQSMDVQVGVSAPVEQAAPEYTLEQPSSVDTPVLDGTRSPLYPSAESVFGQQQEAQTQKQTASETAKDATKNVTEGLYTIGTELGMSFIDQLKNVGDSKLLSDGYTLKREADGSYSATKGSRSAKVYIDNDAVRRDTLLNEAIRSASKAENPYTVGTEKGIDLLQQAKDTGSSVWASDNTEWSYDKENGGFYTNLNGVRTPITVDREALQKERGKTAQRQATENVAPTEQTDGVQYVIGSAIGVLRADNMKPGDRMQTTDDTWIFRNEDGSYTAKRNGKEYSVSIDRDAAQRDPQWAALTAPPAAVEETGTKSKGKSSGSSSGSSSGDYAATLPRAAGTQKERQEQAMSANGDVAALRKQAATAQKEMSDLARQIAAKKAQISAKKAQGKNTYSLQQDASKLQAQYAVAKDRYDQASGKVAVAKSPKNEGQTLIEAATSAPEKKAAVQKEAWRSLPTVADSDRFSINKAADAQTRESERQFFASARRELQQNAWRSLPTVQDSERFSIPSETDELVRQAIASAPRTLSGRPYLPENTGGFSHSGGKSKSTVDRDAALQMNIAMANDDYDTIRRIREKNNYLNDNESAKYLAERAGTGLLGAIQGVGNALSYLFQAKEPEGYDWDNPVMTGAQFAESVSDIKQSFSFADTAAQKMAQRYAGRNIPATQQTAGAVAEGVAGMIPTIAANVAVPGSSLYVLFAQAAGSATTDALQRGATGQQAVTYGVANGALEVLTEKMFDGVAGVFGKGAADEALQSVVRRVTQNEGAQTALLAIADSLGEGFEEFVSEFGDKLLSDMLIKDDSRSFRQVLDDAGESFLVGALTSAVMQAAGSITKQTTPKQAAEQVSEALHEDIKQEAINSNVRAAAEQSPLDRGILGTMRPEAFQQPAQAALYDTQQTTQPTAERSAEGVITGENAKKNASAYAETESTAVNDNPAVHTPQEQAVIEAYKGAVDENLAQFYQYAKSDQKAGKYTLNKVSERAADDIRNLTGQDVDGFKTTLDARQAWHINNDHGINGKADHSMANDTDVARMQYVLDNYDSISYGGTTDAYWEPKANGKNRRSPVVVFSKKVNGTYYVVEATPVTKAQSVYVVSAYMLDPGKTPLGRASRKIGATTQLPDANASWFTANTDSANMAPTVKVPQSPDSVNRNLSADASTGAAPSGFDPLSHASNQYGAIPPGENPPRVVDIPASMDGETKVRRFTRTAAEAQIMTDEMVSRIENLVTDGKLDYEVYKNKQALLDGAKQIERQYERGKSIEQIRNEFIRDANSGKAGAKFVAQGTTLYADAIAAGDYNTASDILVALAAVETNAGQSVQAARLLKTLTPEGRIFTVQKMVSNLEAQVNRGRSAAKQIEINVPDALLNAYQNATTETAQQTALDNIYQNVADQVPTTLREATQQWRYFSMLTNPSTHAKNIVGNVSGTVAKIGKDNLGALMENIILGDREKRVARRKQVAQADVVERYGIDTNTADAVAAIANGWELSGTDKLSDISNQLSRSESARRAIGDLTGQDLSGSNKEVAHKIREIYRNNQTKWSAKQDRLVRTKAFLNAASEADRNLLNLAWADYDTAVDLFEDSVGKYSTNAAAGEINERRRYWKINDPQNAVTRGIDKALGGLEKASEFNTKALEVEDMWFSKPMYATALASYMKANHLTEITDAARTYAMSEAKRGTYNDLNKVSEWATKIGNNSKIGRFLAGTVYPFKKVPANVMVRTVEYSPVGFLKGFYDLYQMGKGREGFTAAKAIDDFAAGATGTALLGVGAAMAKAGILRATGTGDDKEKEQQKNAFGAKDFSILAGDTYIPIDSLTLTGTGLLTGAQIWEAAQNMRNGDEPISLDDILDALTRITDPVFEQSMLTGLDSVISTIQRSDDTGTGEMAAKLAIQIIGNYIGQYVPTVVGRVASSIDKNQRSTYIEPDGAWDPIQSAIQGVQKKVPGWRESMAITYGNWGVPVEGNGAGSTASAIGKAVTPIYPSQKKTDPVEEEISRLHSADSAYSNFYKRPSKTISVDGQSVKLTSKQYGDYVVARGQTDYDLRSAMLGQKTYQSLPDQVKSAAMDLSQEYANEIGKQAAGVGYQSDKKWVNEIAGASQDEVLNAIFKRAVESTGYVSEDTQKQLSKVNQAFAGADYVGLSDEITNSAKEKANEYFSAVEAAKYGGELTATQKELAGKGSKELARYFMDNAIESRFSDTNKNGTKADEYLEAYQNGELNDTMALAVLSDKEVSAYDRFGRSAKVTPKMALQAANAHAGMKDVKDEDGKVTNSAESQFDAWLDKQSWTDDQKSAIRMGFYTDTAKTYSYLSEQLRKGNINTAAAKSELSTSYQAGWSHNVKDTGAKMADYIDAIVEYEERPSEEERKDAEYKNTWSWFCDYLNTTSMTREQKFGIAISMSDYSEGTKQKIWDRLR